MLHEGKKHWIQNAPRIIGRSSLRKTAFYLVDAALDAIDTGSAVRRALRYESASKTLRFAGKKISVKKFRRVFCVAIGKCAVDAGIAIENIFGDVLSGGCVLDVRDGKFANLVSLVGTHPRPSRKSVDETQKIVELLESTTKDDLVIAVISGGGSALLCAPFGFTWQDLGTMFTDLSKCGATIHELNTVRKHCSTVAGGFLAKRTKASVLSLVFSDVPGDDISVVASGPFVKDPTTLEDAARIMLAYGLEDAGRLRETPKDDRLFDRVTSRLVVSNTIALEAMKKRAKELGFAAVIKATSLQGDAHEVGARIARMVIPKNTVYLFGGETTVKIPRVVTAGSGGRARAASLAALTMIPSDSIFVALASDGWDNGDACGGFADLKLRMAAEKLGLNPGEYLSRFDSGTFYDKMRMTLRTGKTGANISDLYFLIRL